jgi:hypothetical protein
MTTYARKLASDIGDELVRNGIQMSDELEEKIANVIEISSFVLTLSTVYGSAGFCPKCDAVFVGKKCSICGGKHIRLRVREET